MKVEQVNLPGVMCLWHLIWETYDFFFFFFLRQNNNEQPISVAFTAQEKKNELPIKNSEPRCG